MLRFVGLVPKFVTRVNAGAACAGPTDSVAVTTASGRSAAASIPPVRRLIYGASFVDVLVMKAPDDLRRRAGAGRPSRADPPPATGTFTGHKPLERGAGPQGCPPSGHFPQRDGP